MSGCKKYMAREIKRNNQHMDWADTMLVCASCGGLPHPNAEVPVVKEKCYRLTIMPALEVGGSYKKWTFDTLEEVVAAKNTSAELLLFIQDTMGIMRDYSNIFEVSELVDGEWEDYYGEG